MERHTQFFSQASSRVDFNHYFARKHKHQFLKLNTISRPKEFKIIMMNAHEIVLNYEGI